MGLVIVVGCRGSPVPMLLRGRKDVVVILEEKALGGRRRRKKGEPPGDELLDRDDVLL